MIVSVLWGMKMPLHVNLNQFKQENVICAITGKKNLAMRCKAVRARIRLLVMSQLQKRLLPYQKECRRIGKKIFTIVSCLCADLN